jgi:cytochrome P450
MIAIHPEVQKRIDEEMKTVFGDSNRDATMNDMAELKYTERCIKETLRLYPSVPFFERHVREDIKLECNEKVSIIFGPQLIVCLFYRWPHHSRRLRRLFPSLRHSS